jgi:lipopolysaccharide export system protein LptA
MKAKLKKHNLIGDAKIIDNDKTLSSQLLVYDMQNKKGYYNNNGKLEMDSTVLVSTRAIYHTQSKIAEFRDKVLITDPNYHLDSDTLHYHTETKVAYFFGPTKIYNDSSTIQMCIIGSYDTKNEIASFGKGTVINNEPQVLFADSLYYERFRSYGKAFYFFDWRDTEMEASMVGTTAEYFENNQEIIAYDRPLLKVKQEDDTLFLKGNIIHTKENEIHGEKEFWSYGSVRIFKTDLQGIADSMFYSSFDSTMRLFKEPFLWNECQSNARRYYLCFFSQRSSSGSTIFRECVCKYAI